MIKYLAFLPYVHRPYLDACLATLKLPAGNMFIVDGTKPDDPGLAGTANQAIDEMCERGADWLIFLNPAMRFGVKGGLDMIEHLERTSAPFVFFGNEQGDHFAWHCCAISLDVIARVGKLDPNFYPVYFEDVDYDLRIRKAYREYVPELLTIDAYNERFGHSVDLAGVQVDTDKLIAYFATKWGVHPAAARVLPSYHSPFNDPNNSLAFWPPARGQVYSE